MNDEVRGLVSNDLDVLDDVDIVIVGAGAAGLATAIFVRRFAPDCSVLVLEGAKKPGAKILVSGGSRCNVTNTVVSERDFWGGRSTIVRRVLRTFTATDTVTWFGELGVALHEEPGGKLFPDSNRSRDVLDALLRAAGASGVSLVTDCRVMEIAQTGDRFRLETRRGGYEARRLVLATGGQSLPKSGSDGAGYEFARRLGHTIVAPTPALTPLCLDDQRPMHRKLAGASHDVEVAIWIDGRIVRRLTGAMLWTHFGVSGPVAMNASRHWLRARLEGSTVSVTLNFCPGRSHSDVDAMLVHASEDAPRATLSTRISTLVPASVASALMSQIGIDSTTTLAHLTRDDRRRLSRALVEWPLPVVGTRGYNQAEATAGGVSLDEIDPATMASRVCRGLYLVGELLDVDGRIGGFNFQWAWSTGFTAGKALAAAVAAHATLTPA